MANIAFVSVKKKKASPDDEACYVIGEYVLIFSYACDLQIFHKPFEPIHTSME